MSSKPPQSIASINLTQIGDDSESLIRAYKKKKAELETLRDQFFTVETQLFTFRQEHSLLSEENQTLKGRVVELERMLKDSQMREIKRDSNETLSR